MKKVLDKYTVAHFFANQVQEEGRTPSHNFYFKGDTLFSYGSHFVIAKHQKDGVVLFTQATYSITTATHISIAHQALSHKKKIYCQYIDNFSQNESAHKTNFSLWYHTVRESVKKLGKARKPEKYFHEIIQIQKTVTAYSEYFKIKIPGNLTEIFKIGKKEEVGEFLLEEKKRAEKFSRKEEKERKKRAILRDLDIKEKLKLFENFELDYVYTHGDNHVVLRYEPKLNLIRTSQGVIISKKEGVAFYELLISGTSLVGFKIDHYIVEKSDEVIQIGCHTFSRKYLLDFGEKHFKIE